MACFVLHGGGKPWTTLAATTALVSLGVLDVSNKIVLGGLPRDDLAPFLAKSSRRA